MAGVTTTTSWAYDELALMYLAAVQGATSWRIDYLYDEEDVVWGGVYRSPSGSTSPTYFTLVTSDRGDTVELCDADGNAFAAYRYDAWGLPQGAGSYATGIWTDDTTIVSLSLAGQIASRQVLRYAGYAWDSESGLYYCSARFYDPATRQWTTGDPAKADGEESAYQYCGGEPVGMVDSTGAYPHPPERPLRRKALSYARNHLGKITRAMCEKWFYGEVLKSEWCAIAQSYVYRKVGSKAIRTDRDQDWDGRWSYVPYLLRDARMKGKRGVTTVARPGKPGDLVLYDWDGDGSPDHVGMVENAGKRKTIEANRGDTSTLRSRFRRVTNTATDWKKAKWFVRVCY